MNEDDLAALEPALVAEVRRRLEEELRAGKVSAQAALADPYAQFGVTPGAAERAVFALASIIKRPDPRGVVAFTLAHAWGEQEGLRRVALALSDPRAKGREREVVTALQAGAGIEAALRQVAAPEPQRDVIPFLR